MTERLDPDTARLLLTEWGRWFGPPQVKLFGTMIDGRLRFREAVSLGLGNVVPKPIELISSIDAAKYLALAGHYDRAREHLPSELRDARDVAAYCHCRIEVVAPLCTPDRLRAPRKRHATPPARRRAIERIAALVRVAEQTDGCISAEQLRKALAPWL